jgi:GntR family transcriptional regulator
MVALRTRPLLSDVVRSELRRAIIEGEFPQGSKLPNEEQLRERYAVSRITLREAVRGLIEDGYVVRRQGSGTYVTRGPALRNSLDTNFSYTEYLEASGIRTSKEILDAKLVLADVEVADDLDIEAGTELVEVRRIRTANRKPAIYSIDSVPAHIVQRNIQPKLYQGSLYQLLAQRGHTVDHARTIITPVIADGELSGILDVPKGEPLQFLRQVDYDLLGRPVMRSLEWHVPAVIELRVYRRGPGALGGQGR